MPIATAPKDGTAVLGWSEYMSEPAPLSWGNKRYGQPGWRAVWDGMAVIDNQTDFGTEYIDPDPITHWMPLPHPPVS